MYTVKVQEPHGCDDSSYWSQIFTVDLLVCCPGYAGFEHHLWALKCSKIPSDRVVFFFIVLDSVKYNKLTDVGVQSLGASLRNCKKMKTLRWAPWSRNVIFSFYPNRLLFLNPLLSPLITGCGISVFHMEFLSDFSSRTAASFGIRMTRKKVLLYKASNMPSHVSCMVNTTQ